MAVLKSSFENDCFSPPRTPKSKKIPIRRTAVMSRSSASGAELKRSSAQHIVSSKKVYLKRSKTNCRKSLRKTAKARGSYLPEPKVLRIQQRYIAGQNKSEIAREEKCDRETVARIVKFPQVQEFIAQQQQEFFGLVPDAMAAVRYALQVGKDSTVGYRVLEATGVAPRKGERLELLDRTPQSGQQRQIEMIANLLLEGHENFGIALPEGVEQALAENSEGCEGAKNISNQAPPSLIAPRGKP